MRHIFKTTAALLCGIASLLTPRHSNAQSSSPYGWEIGAGIGYTNYYGDVSNYRINNFKDLYKAYRFVEFNPRYIHTPSFSLLAQKKLNRSIGFLIQANVLQFEMSDRYRKANGSVDEGSLNYARSLNFRTNLQDLGVALTFNSNNGGLFKEGATFYPSFYLGMGVSHFSVKGDLYDENNNPYNYNAGGYINDGKYETDLRKLNTENESRYNNVVPFLNLGLALNFKLTDFLKLSVQSDIKYSGSDYLDDVSKTYKDSYASPASAYAAKPGNNVVDPITMQRGDNNGVNDFYINNRVVVIYNLRPKKKAKTFNAPVVYSVKRVDTSKRLSYVTIRDTLPLKKKQADSIAARKDSLTKRAFVTVRDSIKRTTEDTVFKSDVNDKLSAIQNELQSIKTVMRNQAIMSRYRYMQYQVDSVNKLSGLISNKRNITPADRLQQRVYSLQQDSIRNEMQKLLFISQYPANSIDSAALNFDPSDPGIYVPAPTVTTVITDTVAERGVVKVETFARDPLKSDTAMFRPRSNTSLREYIDSVNRSGNTYSPAVDNSIAELKSQERYRTDSTYKKRIDSLERRLRSYDRAQPVLEKRVQDSLNKVNNAKIAVMQARIDSLERADRTVVRDTVMKNAIRSKADTTRSRPAVVEERAVVAVDSLENKRDAEPVLIVDTVATRQLQQRLRSNNDSLTALQNNLKASRDSAAYYRRSLYAKNISEEDTIVQKRKWYQRILPKSKKEKEADKETTEATSLREQEAYFDERTKSMSRDLEQLQRDNKNLQDDYDRLARRQSDSRYTRSDRNSSPIIVENDGDNYNSRESRRLRDEISALRAQMLAGTAVTTTAALAAGKNRNNAAQDTVRTVVVNQPAQTQDSAQLAALRSDIASLRAELDSVRLTAPKTAAPVIKNEPVKQQAQTFDAASFPVVSVYFGLGSSTLSARETDKFSPVITAAQRNKNGSILLTGFTDPVGNAAVNKALALKRMNHVKNILVTRYRVPANQILIGEPEISRSGKKANPLDRRVDITMQ
ncbi:MAG: hypothetical protein EOO02_05900 [Chitinophagaceae bacterium]|nr:MAG: hypothetical protein EOO02_05900 [Chitinophagaceae bacterium]